MFLYFCISSCCHERMKEKVFSDVNNGSGFIYYCVIEERRAARSFMFCWDWEGGGCCADFSVGVKARRMEMRFLFEPSDSGCSRA